MYKIENKIKGTYTDLMLTPGFQDPGAFVLLKTELKTDKIIQ